jgi:drug/metabolite transporter (DMT)-like permease
MNNSVKSTLILSLAAMIWGFAFTAQKSGMDHIGPFFFNGFRSLLGALTLIVFLYFRERGRRKSGAGGNETPETPAQKAAGRKAVLQSGVACGVILFVGSNLQQVALIFVSASKTAFITTLYIILVPIFGIFLKHKTHWNTWAGVVFATAGLYFLCMTEALSVAPGDLIVLVSAVFWTLHILVIDHFTSKVDVVKMSCVQFFVSGVLALIVSVFADPYFSESLTFAGFSAAVPAILFAGVLSSGVGFTLQAVGQRYAKPATASIVLSMEAVFGVIGGFLLLGERLTFRETLGCALMLSAVIVAQLPVKQKKAA